MKVHIDEEKCCGSGMCVLNVPEVFDQSDEGLGVVILSSPPDDLREEVHRAVSLCPAMAIVVDEE
jgi:ferredoxin